MSFFNKKNTSEKKVSGIRADFPVLVGGRVVYLDSACQSLRPQSVIAAMTDYYEKYPVCSGRSHYKMAETLDEKLATARADVATFVNAKHAEEIIFTRNTTEGINLIAHSLDFKAGDVIIISDKEHNSNLVPWLRLKEKKGIDLRVVPSLDDNTFNMSAYEKVLQESRGKMKLVAMTMVSNLDGVAHPAEEISKKAHDAGALVLFDAAQAAPHKKVDVQKLDADFLAFSGHKMCGPSGTGVLYGKSHLLEKLEPFMVGGDTVEATTHSSVVYLKPPHKFEAGLQDYAGILGLAEATRYLSQIGFDTITATEFAVNERITAGIKDIPRLSILGPADPKLRGGITSFTVDGVDPHQIAIMLDRTAGVATRSGMHCVHAWFAAHKREVGTIRASAYLYNTIEDADLFVDALKNVLKVL